MKYLMLLSIPLIILSCKKDDIIPDDQTPDQTSNYRNFIICGQHSETDIVYYNFSPDDTIYLTTDTLGIDFTFDAVSDVDMFVYYLGNASYNVLSTEIRPVSGFQLCYFTDQNSMLDTLPADYRVDSTLNWTFSQVQLYLNSMYINQTTQDTVIVQKHPWQGLEDYYFGFRFFSGSHYYYGWAGFSMINNNKAILRDIAFIDPSQS